MAGVDLEDSNLSCVNMRVANLKGSNLTNCILRCANMAGVDLENCNLTAANLTGANLRGANTKGAIFHEIAGALHMSQTVPGFAANLPASGSRA